MSSEFVLRAEGVSKCFKLFARPADRLKQLLFSPLSGRNYFDEFWALNDISVEVKRGESFGIIGVNGAGKSTFLQLVCGTMTPTSGQLQVNGRIAGLLELGSGFDQELSGRENVFINAAILGLTTAQIEERFANIETFAAIGEFIDHPLKTYSSGMRLRLAFAVIAHVDADILIIDEALAVGDVRFVQKCLRFLQAFRKKGTLLLVSHDLSSIMMLCDKAVWFDQGKAMLAGPVKEVCDRYIESQHLVQQHDIEPETDNVAAPSSVAQITRVLFESVDGEAIVRSAGGESARVLVEAKVLGAIGQPSIAFFVKDRLGQPLFGENTESPGAVVESAKSGEVLTASFAFILPKLPAGSYSVGAVVCDQMREDKVLLHWVEDVVVFESVSTDVKVGIFGVSFSGISLIKATKEDDSFCIYPFKGLTVDTTGTVRPCCAFNDVIRENGSPMSVYDHSIDAVWDSNFLQDLRKTMLEGRHVPGCERCNWEKSLGIESMGQKCTKGWEAGWLNEAGVTARDLKSTVADGYVLSPAESIDLHIGNLCNLKCRMCSGHFSSAINADSIHSQWNPDVFPDAPMTGNAWFKRKEFLYGELFREPLRPRHLNLIGGEPFLIPEARDLVRHLVDIGASQTMGLSFVTNLTRIDDGWLELLSRFKTLILILSLDGYASVNDYIRFPSRWKDVQTGLSRLMSLPNAVIYTNMAVQAYNMFGIVDLVRYCESEALDFQYNLLSGPQRLSVFAMPPAVRFDAARKLHVYLEGEGESAKSRDTIAQLAAALEATDRVFDPELLREFMIFTNAMDMSRKQSFAATLPELRQSILDAGFEWASEMHFEALGARGLV